MKVLKFIAITFLLSTTGIAQTKSASFEKEFDEAEKIFSKISDSKKESLTSTKGAYAEVLPVFLNLYKQDPTNMNLAFKIGMCYQSARRDRAKALPYFNKAVTSVSNDYKGSSHKEKNAPLIAYKYLGDAYHWNYDFDKAIVAYRKYISVMEQNNATDKALLSETTRKIEMCNTGKRLVATPIKIKIQNLSNTVNSPYADYSAIFSADQNTLFFTSRRPQSTGGEKDNEGNYMEDIYMSSKTKTGWSAAQSIGAPINTEWHEATVGVSPDAQMILIYKDDMGDGNIYSTSLDGDTWSKPVKLNENINTKHWEPSAFISADGNSLYFASNKPGGFGGLDLYMSKRGSDGDWDKAVNLGAGINTPYDEDAPSIHPDGVTLSFSSNGHNTMGGFDIFSSLLSYEGIWSEPVNVGYPINTTDDDIFYMVSPNGKTAYFSSFREDGLGEKDNYMATFLDKKETPLTLIQGTVNDEAGMPAKKVMITVTDNETEAIVGVYKANAKTGQFLFILTPGKNYNITYQAENHLFYSENIEIPKQSSYYEFKKSVKLHPIVVGSKITLNNIFFDFDKATLRPLSNVELKNLVLLMKSNPNMKVEISGHTDSKGDDAYNLKLSEERAQAVVNRLIEKEISTTRMKAKGYGETQPVAPNTKPNGSDDPEGRQLNRRVELKITEL
ncbi:MAG: OmpA family protein [Bacteroidetes bacterium]|nr:OmpA family protein [Bacteroidota bacterium]